MELIGFISAPRCSVYSFIMICENIISVNFVLTFIDGGIFNCTEYPRNICRNDCIFNIWKFFEVICIIALPFPSVKW